MNESECGMTYTVIIKETTYRIGHTYKVEAETPIRACKVAVIKHWGFRTEPNDIGIDAPEDFIAGVSALPKPSPTDPTDYLVATKVGQWYTASVQ
jgi:hypothetical protein